MNLVAYPELIFAPSVASFIREIVDGKPVTNIPKGWTGILIYHNATGQYYSTKSVKPMEYEEIIRERKEPRWSGIAIALHSLLKQDSQYQFFILPLQARPAIEKWLADHGKRRVATRMGEAAKVEHVLFKVYSPYNKFTRFVAAPSDTIPAKIITKANAGLLQWLKAQTNIHKHERDTMRVALRGKITNNVKVFDRESVITHSHFLSGSKHNQFRTIVTELNFNAIRDFILATVTG